MRGGLDQDGVQDDDGGHGQAVEDVDHAVTVRPVVDAVLMLDDDHIEGIERRGRGTIATGLAVHEVMDDVSARTIGSGCSSTRTTPVSWPARPISDRSAAVNVANPHCVGG